jgi:DNA mismatch repair protein MutS
MAETAATTPLMEQYERVKAQYPGHLVLFRVGDFFETFGDDAKLLSRELEVVLTARSPDTAGERMPMAGVPHHAVDSYLGRLVRKGYKVALCDQVEDARFAKGLVRREVTRVVTPGTVVEDRILPGPDHNFLACLEFGAGPTAAFAAVDLTTGEWFHGLAPEPGLDGGTGALALFAPTEILLADRDASRGTALEAALRREFPRARIDPAPAPISADHRPAFLGAPGEAAIESADRRLARYVEIAQPRLLPFLEVVPTGPGRRGLHLDAKTLRHLEISRPMNPDDPGGATLLSTWDETVTAPGRRTLAFWLRNPIADVAAVNDRLDAVGSLASRGGEMLALRAELKPVADVARIAARVAGRRVRPPELAALRESLAAVARARSWLGGEALPPVLLDLRERLDPLTELHERLRRALPDVPPPTADAGGLFRVGFASTLDEVARAEEAGLAEMEALERREQSASGIRGLKVGYNQVFGYYLEVSRPNLARVPPHFRRKQTLSSGERFTTEELAAIEERILSARERRREEEASAWERFLVELEPSVPRLHRLARAIGELDALATFALIAQERRLVRPIVDDSTTLQIRDGRHPVLERSLEAKFVPNDIDLDREEARLLVLTGPNMSGKSTYMRQVGLLVVLAQCGSYVPARFARIGLVSSLYTRMGFTDEIGRGKSSFMVEMTEVAEILRAADERSLVLLDEVGRGTSTFDGLALAWATLRHLHDRIGCRTILATHYHQLTELVEGLPSARNAHLAVRETGDEVVFLHRLVPGSTDRSYGLHVARLAGVPPPVIEEAQRLLKRLEAGGVGLPPATRRGAVAPTRYTQAVLLAHEPAQGSAVESALRDLDPDAMSPIEALHWITESRKRLLGDPPQGAP